MSQEMNECLNEKFEQMNALFEEASALKDTTRQSPSFNNANTGASQKFELAATIARKLLESPDLPVDMRLHLTVYAPYYSYESQATLRGWHYERHETDKAEACQKCAETFLDEHIRQIDESITFPGEEDRSWLERTQKKAKFFRGKDEVVTLSIRARAAWDRGDFIAALDQYRTAIPKLAALIEQARELDNPAYCRVTLGNYISMVANSSAALAKHITKTHVVPGLFPHDLASDLIRHTLDAYRAGMEACKANPEWTQYRGIARMCRENVERFLCNNKDSWPEIYTELHDVTDLVKIMGIIDLKLLKRIERGDMPEGDDKLRILFLAANPLDTNALRLDAEFRNIQEKLDLSKAGDKITLKQEWAVRVTDLQRALLKNNPTIVHFTGHGSDDGDIILEDANGDSHVVPPDALADLFRTLSADIRCVVLSSCNSSTQADGIVQHVDIVITMSDEVDDDAANAFASGFYQALAWGTSVQQAFDLGCNQMALEKFDDANVPILKAGDGIDASALYLIGDKATVHSDNFRNRMRQLCLSLCKRWRRYDHVAFRVDEAKTVMANASADLFEFVENESKIQAVSAHAIQAVASELKTLSERRVKRASIFNTKTGEVDDDEEKQFRAEGDALFQRLGELAQDHGR